MKKVTVVGTRYPHDNIVPHATKAVTICVKAGCTISTGDAIGIDRVASRTTRFVNRNHPLEIYSAKGEDYEWKNNWTCYLYQMKHVNIAAALAEAIHPAWDRCGEYARDLHTRNAYQVMGLELLNPTDLTLTFAPAETNVKGGTRTAYMLSKGLGLPTVNLYGGDDEVIAHLWEDIFISDNKLNWSHINNMRTKISDRFKRILIKHTEHDPVLAKAFADVYRYSLEDQHHGTNESNSVRAA